MATLVGMSQPSVLYQLVEARLDGTLVDYVAEKRASMSWRAMAADLQERTGVELTHQTLVNWFGDRIQTTVTIANPAATA